MNNEPDRPEHDDEQRASEASSYAIEVEINDSVREALQALDLPPAPQWVSVRHAFERRTIDTFGDIVGDSIFARAIGGYNFQHEWRHGTYPETVGATDETASELIRESLLRQMTEFLLPRRFTAIVRIDLEVTSQSPAFLRTGATHNFMILLGEDNSFVLDDVFIENVTISVPRGNVISFTLRLQAASLRRTPSLNQTPSVISYSGERHSLHVHSWTLEQYEEAFPPLTEPVNWTPSPTIAQIAAQHTGDAITRAFAVQSADVGFVVYALLDGAVFLVDEFPFTPPDPWTHAMLGEYAVAAACFGTVESGICQTFLPLEERNGSELFPDLNGIRIIGRTRTLWHNHAAIVSGVLAGRIPHHPIDAIIE